MESSKLFQPLTLGDSKSPLKLSHRIGLCPLTRYRASDEHVASPLAIEYYAQRASTPGTLLISEGTFISAVDGGMANVPGIYTKEQITAWKQVTDAVHSKGSLIFCQLWSLGRSAVPAVAESEHFQICSADVIPLGGNHPVPHRLSQEEIQERINNYVQAAKNAIAAGFDGVELHGANGYLIDQFLQDNSNQRTDEYGGNIENRSRFALELSQAVCKAIGSGRVGIRLSPWSTFAGMRMEQPIPQFSDIITKLSKLKMAYLHLVESRISGSYDSEGTETLSFAFEIWNGPVLVAGGYTPQSAQTLVDKEYPNKDIVVMFGRYFISNPDLPYRIRKGIPFTPYDRSTFYTPKVPQGYIDFPFSDSFLQSSKV